MYTIDRTIVLNNISGVSQGTLVVSDSLIEDTVKDKSIEHWASNSLGHSQLVVLSSCLSGGDAIQDDGGLVGDNLAGRLYWLGSHNVASHYHKTGDESSVAWDTAFMTEVLLGRSLKTAKMRADNHLCDDY